jgi:hypothetical protein
METGVLCGSSVGGLSYRRKRELATEALNSISSTPLHGIAQSFQSTNPQNIEQVKLYDQGLTLFKGDSNIVHVILEPA